MSNLVSPFGKGTIEERHQQRLLNDAAEKKKEVTLTEEIMVSVVTDLRTTVTNKGKKHDPLFETHINIGLDAAIEDICDSIGWIFSDENLSDEERIDYLSNSFILTRQSDGRYVKSDLILFIRKNMIGHEHELMIYYDDEEVGYIDDLLDGLANNSIQIQASEDDEPDINDCRDITMDAGFGKI